MKNLDQIIDKLPAARRAKIEGRARELIGQEMALQQLRKARHLTQLQMARTLKIGQDSVSRLENRSDLLLSTLQSYVEAMGGKLSIVAEFKDGWVALSGLNTDEPPERPKRGVAKKTSVRQKAAPRRKGHLKLAHAR